MFNPNLTSSVLKYQNLWRGIAYAMLVMILIASLLPTEYIEAPGSDKLHHFLSYAVLAWWCVLAFQIQTSRKLLILIVLLVCYGACIELLQGLSGYRFAEWYDLLANTMGVFIGTLFAFYVMKGFLSWVEFRLKR